MAASVLVEVAYQRDVRVRVPSIDVSVVVVTGERIFDIRIDAALFLDRGSGAGHRCQEHERA
jgi:hypothetical protein